MPETLSIKGSRRLVNLFFAYLGVATLLSGLWVSRRSRNWVVSDWLINYEGGFVRRGLPGEVAFLLGRLVHVSPIAFVVAFYLLFFAVFLLAAWHLALRSSLNFWVLGMLVCPATLSLQILSPQAAFHKEIIYISLLAGLLALAQRISLRPLTVCIALCAFAVLGLLSHEALVCFAPYLIAALLLSGQDFRTVFTETALPAVLALGIVFICSRHLGSPEIVHNICASLGYGGPNLRPLDICSSGAIPYLIRDPSFARHDVLITLEQNGFFKLRVLPILTLLALIPAIQVSRLLRRAHMGQDVGVVWISAGISFLASLMLFVYAVDWGRWLYIHIISITLLLLYADGKTSLSSVSKETYLVRYRLSRVTVCVLVLYMTTWSLPNGADGKGVFGYAERFVDAVLSKRHHATTAQLSMPSQRTGLIQGRDLAPGRGD